MLNFVIYISMLSRAEGHKYQSVLFSTKHTSVCKQWSESLVRCKTSVGYSHKNIDYIPLSSNINIFTGRMLGFVIYIKMSWHELPDFCYMHNNVMNSHLSKYQPHTCLQNQWSGHVFELSLLHHITRSMSSMCRNTHGKHIPCHAVYHTLLCI